EVDADRRALAVERVVDQSINIGDRSLAGRGIVIVAGDDERAGRVARYRLRQRAGGDHRAPDRHAADAVDRSEGDGAAGRSATTSTAPEVRTRGLAVAARQVGFVYDGAAIAFARDEGDDGRRVGDTDGQGRRRCIAVAVGNLIGEDVLDAARRAGIADVGI